MSLAANFISYYIAEFREQIDFAWNGKHAEEFEDSNQEFRWQVVSECIAHPEYASPILLEHLFLADAEWAAEAWGTPHHFAQLGELLLKRGQETVLEAFSRGFVRSFDTFGACHYIRLDRELLLKLSVAANEQLAQTIDKCQKKQFEAVIELLTKIEKNTATQG